MYYTRTFFADDTFSIIQNTVNESKYTYWINHGLTIVKNHQAAILFLFNNRFCSYTKHLKQSICDGIS